MSKIYTIWNWKVFTNCKLPSYPLKIPITLTHIYINVQQAILICNNHKSSYLISVDYKFKIREIKLTSK